MKKLKNAMKYIATVFLVLLVSLCIYTFVVTDIMKKDYVNVFGYSYFVVATGSMSGEIEVDDIIFVRLTKDVKVNDIITFKDKDGSIITHRLMSKNGSSYITKGDVNNISDEPITKDQIIGKVRFVVSPSFILKSIAVFLIIFIFLALVNFDVIVKKYIVKEEDNPDIPDDIFQSKSKYDEPSSGLTQTIMIDEMEKISKKQEADIERDENIEVLDFDEYLFDEPVKKKKKDTREKDVVDLVVTILKSKKNNIAKAKMNKRWLIKYQYVYKLSHLLLNDNTESLVDLVSNPPFKEIFDYDLERVGLTETIRNKLNGMPIYVYLRLMTYSILYNDDEMFDGLYKILKYKVQIDESGLFKKINLNDKNKVKTLIEFMKKVSSKFDKKNVFELEKIERMVKIGNY